MSQVSSEYFVGAGFAESVRVEPTITKQQVNGVSRAWDVAETNRLNADHWRTVMSDDINEDMSADLPTIQQRSRYEAINNPLIEGAIETHCTDIAGESGPGLQMLTGYRRYDDAVEQIWNDWCESCEFTNNFHLVDLLHGWIGQLWYNGEFFAQDYFDDSGYFLIDHGAERLDFGSDRAQRNGNSNFTTMGIETDAIGRPVAYWIRDPSTRTSQSKSRRLPVTVCHHGFRRRFAGQIRGIPILASSLATCADLRDFDSSTMDAARLAAENSVWFVTTHPDAQYHALKPGQEFDLPRRSAKAAPPLWDVRMNPANHPTPQYVQFREERERDVGRPAQQPLMITRADSSKHNLSSARYDGVRYARACGRVQAWFGRRMLSPLLQRVITIARLRGELRRDPPRSGVYARWAWPRPPANDPLKERMAERVGLENGTLNYSDACAANGIRPDVNTEQRRRDNEDLQAAGLQPIVGAIPTKFLPAPVPWLDDDDSERSEDDNRN